MLKASRQLLLGAIHGAVVTHVDFERPDALLLDPVLMAAAGFLPHEKVELFAVDSGARLSCVLMAGASGQVALHGASAHHAKPGDRVSLAVYGWFKAKAALKHVPQLVQVDAENQKVP